MGKTLTRAARSRVDGREERPPGPRAARTGAAGQGSRQRGWPHRHRHEDPAEDQEAVPLQSLLLNDDYTPMEFVVLVLEKFFNKGREEATRIMLHVHHKGVGDLRGLHLRGCRNQGDAGHGLFTPARPSSTMHHGERVGQPCHPSRRALKARCIARWSTPTSAATNLRRSSICCLRLIDDRDAAAVMRACNVDLEKLRARVTEYLDNELGTLVVQGQRRGAADHRLPARHPARRGARAVFRPRGSDRRQRAGRHLRRAREPRRLLPAGAGDDALRRRPIHQPRHRQAPRHVRAAHGARRRRGADASEGEEQASRARTRSTPIASTSTRRRATARSIR